MSPGPKLVGRRAVNGDGNRSRNDESRVVTDGQLGYRPAPAHLWLTDQARSGLAQTMGLRMDDALDLAAVYTDLHANPELGFHETRTAALVAAQLTASGFDVTIGVGGTGVVGVLGNGGGPLVVLRADMDALPVEEKTRQPYASVTLAITDSGIDVPVMHACGHDVHVTCLLGACAVLSADPGSWSGTLVAVFQPAESWALGLGPWLRTACSTGSTGQQSYSGSMSALSRQGSSACATAPPSLLRTLSRSCCTGAAAMDHDRRPRWTPS
jgi:hypothetical protein